MYCDNTLKEIYEIIKERHHEKKLKFSLPDFAKVIGCSRQTIYNNFDKNVSRLFMNKIVKMFLTKNIFTDNELRIFCKSFNIKDLYEKKLEENQEKIKLSEAILGKLKIDFENLIIYELQEDSMSPELRYRDKIVIDKSRNEIKDGFIYLIEYKSKMMCRKLQNIEEKVKIISLNTQYDDFQILRKKIKVIGKALGLVRNLF